MTEKWYHFYFEMIEINQLNISCLQYSHHEMRWNFIPDMQTTEWGSCLNSNKMIKNSVQTRDEKSFNWQLVKLAMYVNMWWQASFRIIWTLAMQLCRSLSARGIIIHISWWPKPSTAFVNCDTTSSLSWLQAKCFSSCNLIDKFI